MTSVAALPEATTRHFIGIDAAWPQQLATAFRHHPVWDGYNHPAEPTICYILQYGSPEDHRRIENIAVDAADPVTAYGVLHALPQVDPPWDDRRKAALIQLALTSPGITIRDAGIRAAEHWPCPETLAAIEHHRDPDPMLENYANAVAYDIREYLALPSP